MLHNYFNGLTKLFSDLYLVKFLDILAKTFLYRLFTTFTSINTVLLLSDNIRLKLCTM